MNCTACGGKDLRTRDTRSFHDPHFNFYYAERRRECLSCGHRFKTIEVDVEVWNERVDYGIDTGSESQEEGD